MAARSKRVRPPELARPPVAFAFAHLLQGVAVDETRLRDEAAIDLLVDPLRANELGLPTHEKIVAARGRWVAGTSVRRR
jgi:hypothetical protein